MSKMIMMIGLPSSGKSTYAKELTQKENAIKQKCILANTIVQPGIKILIDEIEASSFGSFAKKFERDLFEFFEKLGLGGEYDQKNSLKGL